MTTPSTSFILVLFLTFAAQTASAQATPGPKVSSRDEYRVCLEEGDKLTSKMAVLQARLKDHDQSLKQLQDDMVRHAATQPVPDTDDEAAVSLFNAKADALNLRAKALNAQVEEFNKAQIEYNTQIAASNKRCAGMVITLKDRDAVHRERVVQGKK